MSRFSLTLLALWLCLPFATLSAQWREDTLLSGFEQIRVEDSDMGAYATLVRRTPLIDSGRAVLYIHGYNDYFFQQEMAERFSSEGYNFYALDLRGYGRSMVEGEQPFQVECLSDYFRDINAAIDIIVEQDGAESLVLMGHSTGGLTLSLYCAGEEYNPLIEAVVLNSPFFDMNLGWFVERAVVPIFSQMGRNFPDIALPGSDDIGAYAQSLLKKYQGEWEYDESLKFSTSLPITARWIRAIHQGHRELQAGLDIPYPLLVMRSDNSVKGSKWSAEHQSGDSVLDVEDIAKYSSVIGDNVTLVTIEGALHDIILSAPSVRNHAYGVIFEWLD